MYKYNFFISVSRRLGCNMLHWIIIIVLTQNVRSCRPTSDCERVMDQPVTYSVCVWGGGGGA